MIMCQRQYSLSPCGHLKTRFQQYSKLGDLYRACVIALHKVGKNTLVCSPVISRASCNCNQFHAACFLLKLCQKLDISFPLLAGNHQVNILPVTLPFYHNRQKSDFWQSCCRQSSAFRILCLCALLSLPSVCHRSPHTEIYLAKSLATAWQSHFAPGKGVELVV